MSKDKKRSGQKKSRGEIPGIFSDHSEGQRGLLKGGVRELKKREKNIFTKFQYRFWLKTNLNHQAH
ncbi:MAG TPA: hypothetical protein DDW49_10040 [Deltaproteobacteria bacterium]|nr:MAG: hypothetical protein A2048_02660 [Deltaproteobacteria bacterium GWA2_45_12]HBF13703.1 hypothetical protein [Deltaproteobacteria bacterium]